VGAWDWMHRRYDKNGMLVPDRLEMTFWVWVFGVGGVLAFIALGVYSVRSGMIGALAVAVGGVATTVYWLWRFAQS
jgi:hypothetical protein